MDLLPKFKVGLLNGWIPLLIYFIALIISVLLYSKEARIWLFNNPKDPNKGVLVLFRLFGQLAVVTYIMMMIFAPLKIHNLVFLVCGGIYSIGFLLEMIALYYFRIAPIGQPVIKGPYRVSRNPQWLGLFLVLLGSAIATGIWLYIAIIIVAGIIYHIQILDEETACMNKYGESCREYMNRVPRYLLFV
jgi:protein-S-isoprenylcysteine O-methyltransferase Ste14